MTDIEAGIVPVHPDHGQRNRQCAALVSYAPPGILHGMSFETAKTPEFPSSQVHRPTAPGAGTRTTTTPVRLADAIHHHCCSFGQPWFLVRFDSLHASLHSILPKTISSPFSLCHVLDFFFHTAQNVSRLFPHLTRYMPLKVGWVSTDVHLAMIVLQLEIFNRSVDYI